jgi:hypothetical protein
MAGTFRSIYRCEVSLHIPGIHAAYRTRLARACRGKRDRSVTRPADSFLGEDTPIRTCPGSHWAVRCRTTACQSPRCRFSLEMEVVLLMIRTLCFYPMSGRHLLTGRDDSLLFLGHHYFNIAMIRLICTMSLCRIYCQTKSAKSGSTAALPRHTFFFNRFSLEAHSFDTRFSSSASLAIVCWMHSGVLRSLKKGPETGEVL